MRGDEATIDSVKARAYRVPTDAPESDGTYEWSDTVLVVVEASAAGATGVGYTYADRATASVVHDKLGPAVAGSSPATVGAAYERMLRSVRNIGREGIAAMAISAVDLALWDLRGKIAGECVASLLGAMSPPEKLGPTFSGITGDQEPTRWRADGSPRSSREARTREAWRGWCATGGSGVRSADCEIPFRRAGRALSVR